jgi:membrane fusion protein, multidrug efflux system
MNKMIGYILAILVLMSGCKKKAEPPVYKPEVATITTKYEKAIITTELAGRTSAYLVAEIRPQVNGLIKKRLFTEGSEVKQGQILYEIDPAPFKAALDNAQASLTMAQAGLLSVELRAKRYKDLLSSKAISQQDYDDASAAMKQGQAQIELCKASVETARINLDYTKVTAPISGRIGRSSVTDGALVTAYQPTAMATIQQFDPIYVDVPQSTAELLSLKRSLAGGQLNQDDGQKKVKLILGDGTEYQWPGKLQFQDVTVDPTTGSVIIRIVFPNPEGILLPNMFVRAVITEGVNEQAVLVPQQAVARNPNGQPLVLIVDGDGKVQQKMLTIDRAVGDKWLVSSGLNPGERVVVEGIQKVRPGVPVTAVSLDAAGKGGQMAEGTESIK